MLWVNTPPQPPMPESSAAADLPAISDAASPQTSATGGATMLAFALGGLQGAAAIVARRYLPHASDMITLAYLAASLVVVARVARGAAAMRVGGWAATYAVAFGLGVMSLAIILPNAVRAIATRDVPPLSNAAWGFAAWAPEAAMIASLAAASFGAGLLPRRLAIVCGVAVVLAAIVLILWRLDILPPYLAAI